MQSQIDQARALVFKMKYEYLYLYGHKADIAWMEYLMTKWCPADLIRRGFH